MDTAIATARAYIRNPAQAGRLGQKPSPLTQKKGPLAGPFLCGEVRAAGQTDMQIPSCKGRFWAKDACNPRPEPRALSSLKNPITEPASHLVTQSCGHNLHRDTSVQRLSKRMIGTRLNDETAAPGDLLQLRPRQRPPFTKDTLQAQTGSELRRDAQAYLQPIRRQGALGLFHHSEFGWVMNMCAVCSQAHCVELMTSDKGA